MAAIITYLAEQHGACMWYRCRVPARALSRAGHDAAVPELPDGPRLESSDVIVLQRPTRPISVLLMQHAKSLGKLTVVDMDDDLWNIHPSNPAYRAWQEPASIKTLEDCLREADLVTVTTPELAALTRRFNRNTVVLPNMLNEEDWEPAPAGEGAERPGDIVVGWAGSATHLIDLMPLAGVVEDLLNKYPHVEVRVAGMSKLPFRPHDRLTVAAGVPLAEYPSLIAGFDIGLAPVVDGRFNRCKSDLKYLEYAMLGIPTIASRAETYSRTVRHGKNGFLAHNPKDWLTYTSRLIESEDLRMEMGAEAKRYARSRLIDVNIGMWLDAYGLGHR